MTETATESATTATDEATADLTENLGDAGKQALDRMKAERNEAAKSLKAAQRELAEARASLQQLNEASQTDQEKAVAQARREAEAAVVERVNTRLVKAEARAIAAEIGFADATDAVALVDLSGITVNDDGDVDSEAVKRELADLAERKKYLLKPKQDTSATDAGIGTTGAVATDGSPQSLIRAGLAHTSKTK